MRFYDLRLPAHALPRYTRSFIATHVLSSLHTLFLATHALKTAHALSLAAHALIPRCTRSLPNLAAHALSLIIR